MKEKLFFENSNGNKLCGILSNPTKDRNEPIIIACHGFSSSKDSGTYVQLESSLNFQKISTFRFDFYGHGESEGKFEDITISEAVDDAMHAIDFIKSKGYTKIGLFGSSFGGITSIITASTRDDLFVLTLKSPVSNYMEKLLIQRRPLEIEEWKNNGFIIYDGGPERKLRLNYSFYEDSIKQDGYKTAENIKIPTIIVHGDQDETVPVEQSIKIAGIIKNCKLKIIKGLDHRYTRQEHREKMLKLITEFIVENSS